MPKATPSTARTGKRKASSPPEAPQSRIAKLMADALSKDEAVLKEISQHILQKSDGTSNQAPGAERTSDDEQPSEQSIEEDLTSVTSDNNEGVNLGLFSTVHPPIDVKMRKAIMNKEYIDLNKLIFDHQTTETTVIKRSDNQITTSVQKSAPKTITNIITWCRAFQRFADVYVSKYPEEASGLFQYMSIIEDLAQHSPNWVTYDIKFRQLKALQPLPWGNLTHRNILVLFLNEDTISL